MPDTTSGTQSASTYSTWDTPKPDPVVAPTKTAVAKPKPKPKPRAKAAAKPSLAHVETSSTSAKGSESPEIIAMGDKRVIETSVLAKGASGNVGSTITVKEADAALIDKQDDRIFMGRVEDGEGLPRHRAEDGPEPDAGDSVLVPPERGPQIY